MKKYLEYIKEYKEPNDVIIDVVNKNYLIDSLIENLSLLVRKKKLKNIHIKKVKGYINKEQFTKKGFTYETYLEAILSNDDILIGEYIMLSKTIIIKINDTVVYDMDNKLFDNEYLIEKLTNEYIKHLKTNNFSLK